MTIALIILYSLVALESVLDFWTSEDGSLIRKAKGLGRLLVGLNLLACLLWPIPVTASLVSNLLKLFQRKKVEEIEDLPPK